MAACPKCLLETKEDQKFCPGCGANLLSEFEKFLDKHGLGHLVKILTTNDITSVEMLKVLDENDLVEMGFAYGDKIRVMMALESLKKQLLSEAIEGEINVIPRSDCHPTANLRLEETQLSAAPAKPVKPLRCLANLYVGLEAVGGFLYIDDKKLIFKPHPLNIQTDEVIINVNDISHMALSNNLLIIPNGLNIYAKSGQEFRFVVYKRKKILEYINKIITSR